MTHDTIESKEKTLIDLALKYIFDCSGDGGALIVGRDYQRFADLFESMNAEYQWSYKRQEEKHKTIAFQNEDGESMVFSRWIDIDNAEFYDFVAIV